MVFIPPDRAENLPVEPRPKVRKQPAISTTTLEFRRSGTRGATSVVFLHGGGAGPWMWEPVVRLLPEYDCIIPNRPGTGGRRQGLPLTIARAAATAGLVDPGGSTNAAQQHNWALTAPELFANTVRAWIDGTPLPPSIGRLDF